MVTKPALTALDTFGERAPVLGVVLLNPPEGTGTATRRNLAVAVAVLGDPQVRLANLFAKATKNVAAINVAGAEAEGWIESRPELEAVLRESDEVLFGWGVGSLSGAANHHFLEQIDWLHVAARQAGHSTFWSIGSEPRHPSRWHQYVSDRHGRTAGGTITERVAEVLVRLPLR